jgi:ABC-type molybdate transport system substrate-binding protein
MLYLLYNKPIKTTDMKYIFTMFGIALLLTGCSNLNSTTNISSKSEQITVFTSDGIVYVNDGF